MPLLSFKPRGNGLSQPYHPFHAALTPSSPRDSMAAVAAYRRW